jgi:hypothetical protein
MDTTNGEELKVQAPAVVLGLRPYTDMVVRMITMWKQLGKEPALIWMPMEWCIQLCREIGTKKIERRFKLNGVEFRACDGAMTVIFKG